MQKALNQIHSLSSQIQTTVKQALEQPYKNQSYCSPQETTHHHTNYHSVNVQKTEAKNVESINVRQFINEEENELLVREIEQLREKGREYRAEIKELKRYVKFLEQYNDDLKREVVLWMTRPAKKESSQELDLQEKLKNYRSMLGQVISRPKSNFQGLNDFQGSLTQENHKGYQSTNANSQNVMSSSFNVKNLRPKIPQDASIRYEKPRTNKKINHSIELNECTSCNYMEHKNKNKRSKNYEPKNISQHLNPETGGIRNKLKIEKKPNSKPSESYSIDLQTYRNSDNLCPCHRGYLTNKGF